MTKALTTIFKNHHSFLKLVSWRHLARDFRFSVWISISGFESLFLGLSLYFWVWVFVCVWVCVSNVQRQGNVWQRSTSSATTIGDATNGGRWSLSSFFVLIFFFFLFWFGSLLVWDLFNLRIGFERGLGMVICKFVGIFWFRICLKMALILWFC